MNVDFRLQCTNLAMIGTLGIQEIFSPLFLPNSFIKPAFANLPKLEEFKINVLNRDKTQEDIDLCLWLPKCTFWTRCSGLKVARPIPAQEAIESLRKELTTKEEIERAYPEVRTSWNLAWIDQTQVDCVAERVILNNNVCAKQVEAGVAMDFV